MTDPPSPLTGAFEAHLTVPLALASGGAGWRGRFEESCAELGLKPLLIEALGATLPLQAMTASFHHGPLAAVEEQVRALAAKLVARGFPPQRLKLEAVGRANPYLPESASDLAWGPDRYFEFHVQVKLSSPADLTGLKAFAREKEVHLSRNPRRTHSDGATDRFVTLRLREVGRAEALRRHAELCQALTREGFRVTPGTIELALLDTCVELDAGWAL